MQEELIKQENPAIIFLHYFGGSAQSWAWVIDHLSKDFSCFALNIPGFGGLKALPKPSIKKLAVYLYDEIINLGYSKYILVGHSMGAKIAVQMKASKKNGSIKHLILVAPSPPGIEPIENKEKKRMLHHPDFSEAKTTIQKITKTELSLEKFDLAVQNNLIADPTVWTWWLEKGMNHSITTSAENLQVPITIIKSESDPVITPQIIAERLLTVFPNAKVITTKTSGHLIPLESPEWLAEEIRKVIKV